MPVEDKRRADGTADIVRKPGRLVCLFFSGEPKGSVFSLGRELVHRERIQWKQGRNEIRVLARTKTGDFLYMEPWIVSRQTHEQKEALRQSGKIYIMEEETDMQKIRNLFSE